jgi:hypothetical protein
MTVIDSILTYHTDAISCGVCKFNNKLAEKLHVSCLPILSRQAQDCIHPLLSLKFKDGINGVLGRWSSDAYDMFLHDWEDIQIGHTLLGGARRVFAASAEVAEQLCGMRPDVIPAWCPSLVEAHPREPITVLSFGMAHKIRTDLYATLKDKLDATGEPYVVYVSAALHEGTTFADAAGAFEALRRLFGPRFVFLGTLSDEAMVDRLRTCTYVAAFFESGLRENNTSVMAAIDHGATVITNWDAQTPEGLRHLTIHVDATLPHVARRQRLRNLYGWDALVELIRNA